MLGKLAVTLWCGAMLSAVLASGGFLMPPMAVLVIAVWGQTIGDE